MNFVVPLLAAALVAAGSLAQTPDWQPRFLGSANLRHAAFIEAYFSEDESVEYEDRWSLYISRFDPGMLGQFDPKYYMRSPGRYLDNIENWENLIQTLDENAYWPNNPDYLPSEVAGAEGIVWTSGFLVSTKTDGQLQLYDTTQEPPVGPYNIASTDTEDWAYHRVLWKDMDADGDLDALTCRFHVPLVGRILNEVMYYENPSQGFSEGWTERILNSEGGDVHFAVTVLSAGGRDYEVIILAEFFQKRLSIMWTESETEDWTDSSLVNYRVVDAEADQTFDLLVDDFNRDGTIELMVSSYDTEAGVGRASVYTFPEDFRTDEFPVFTVADGFIPNPSATGDVMSPGTFKTFYPSTAYEGELAADGLPHKPWVMLSGDDDGNMYILHPASDDRQDWTYQKQVLTETGGDIAGKMALGDFDNDGYTDVVVAGYSVGLLYVYTYAPV